MPIARTTDHALSQDGHRDRAQDGHRDRPQDGHHDPVAGGDLVEAVIGAGRVLVGLAIHSVAEISDDVTLTQHSVLSELAERGPQRVADLAAVLGVNRSTATRMCDRLVRKGLVHRRRMQDDRRGVRIALAPAGRELVSSVAERRREAIQVIVARMPEADRGAALEALRAFRAAAGEGPEQSWSRGWELS